MESTMENPTHAFREMNFGICCDKWMNCRENLRT